jgi:hypothetical protein
MEIYVQGEEIPVAMGHTFGTKADVDAAILEAKARAVNERKGPD